MARILAHDALLIASPENNQPVSSLLKNVIDWPSRSIGDGKAHNSVARAVSREGGRHHDRDAGPVRRAGRAASDSRALSRA